MCIFMCVEVVLINILESHLTLQIKIPDFAHAHNLLIKKKIMRIKIHNFEMIVYFKNNFMVMGSYKRNMLKC